MANKKLTVEVELETAKAKKQAEDIVNAEGKGSGGEDVKPASPSTVENLLSRLAKGHSASSHGGAGMSAPQKPVAVGKHGGDSGSSAGADKLAGSLGRAANSADRTASSLSGMQGAAARLTRGFAGIAVGMATSYAANYATGRTKTALEYAGTGISGAVGGAMMAGLPGAIVGGLAGVLKTYMDRDAHNSAVAKDFKIAEDTYENNRLWQAKMRDLSEVDYSPANLTGTKLTEDKISKTDERLEQVKQVAVQLFEEQNKIIQKINDHLKAGETEEAEKLQNDLAIVRTKKEQAEGLERSFAKQKKSLEHQLAQEKHAAEGKIGTFRTATSATDSLSRIGGSFAGGADYTRDMIRKAEQQIEELKKISSNTSKKGSATWA